MTSMTKKIKTTLKELVSKVANHFHRKVAVDGAEPELYTGYVNSYQDENTTAMYSREGNDLVIRAQIRVPYFGVYESRAPEEPKSQDELATEFERELK